MKHLVCIIKIKGLYYLIKIIQQRKMHMIQSRQSLALLHCMLQGVSYEVANLTMCVVTHTCS